MCQIPETGRDCLVCAIFNPPMSASTRPNLVTVLHVTVLYLVTDLVTALYLVTVLCLVTVVYVTVLYVPYSIRR